MHTHWHAWAKGGWRGWECRGGDERERERERERCRWVSFETTKRKIPVWYLACQPEQCQENTTLSALLFISPMDFGITRRKGRGRFGGRRRKDRKKEKKNADKNETNKPKNKQHACTHARTHARTHAHRDNYNNNKTKQNKNKTKKQQRQNTEERRGDGLWPVV